MHAILHCCFNNAYRYSREKEGTEHTNDIEINYKPNDLRFFIIEYKMKITLLCFAMQKARQRSSNGQHGEILYLVSGGGWLPRMRH